MRFPKVSTTKNVNGIPENYTEVEYIESTGTQWIDTGVIPTKDIGARMSFLITNTISGDACMLMSGGDNVSYRWGFSCRLAGAQLQVSGLMKANLSWENYSMTVNTPHIVDYNYNNYANCYLDGTLIRSNIPGGDVSRNNTIYIFASNDGTGTIWRPSTFKLYSLKMTDNGNIIRDFVPVLDENNKPGLYDKITGTMFYNQASSGNDFSYGKKITYIDYLQASGTQYIDTGYKPNNNTKIDLIGKFNNTYPCCLWASRWSQSPDYDTYGAYAENNSAGMLYVYCGKYSAGNFTGVDNTTFPHRDGNYIRFIQDKNKVDFTNLGSGANWTYTFNEETFQSTRNLALFYFSSPSAFNTKGGYIKSCKIYDNGIMIRDFVAVRDENNTGYMFDKVSHRLFSNAGSGTFTLGSDITQPSKTPIKLIKTPYVLNDLPAGYTPVEYLESSGTQCIDTGIIDWNDTIEYEIKLDVRAQVSVKTYYGCYNAWGPTGTIVPALNTFVSNYRMQQNFNTGFSQGSGALIGITIGQVGVISLRGNTLSWSEGSSVPFDRTPSGFVNNCPVMLFSTYYSGAPKEHATFAMYYAKWWLNGEMVRDFVPCLDPSGRPCMYDKVEEKPYYNVGTGEFTYGKKIIPVEYLQSSGTQYINTGYIQPGIGLKAETTFEFTAAVGGEQGIVGRTSGNGFEIFAQNNKIGVWNGASKQVIISLNPIQNYPYHLIGEIKSDSITLEYNKTTYKWSGTTVNGADPATATVSLFNHNNSYHTSGKMYFCKLWDNGVLVRDLIPVKDENGVGYMYDKLHNTLYGNLGTGDFIVGNEKKLYKTNMVKTALVPAGYTRVKYLESSGVQYIDTGILPGSYSKAKIGFEWKDGNIGNDKYIIGSVSSASMRYYFGTYQSKWQYGYCGSTNQAEGIEENKYYDVYVTWDPINQLVVLNGETIITNNNSTDTTSDNTFALFGRHQGNSFNPAWLSKSKIYYCKIYTGTTIVRDYIPVIRNSDNKPGMWDRVSKTFFTNGGSGDDFTYESL